MVLVGSDLILVDSGSAPPPTDPNLLYNDTAEANLYYTDNANTIPLEISGGGPSFGELTTAYSAAIVTNGGTITPDKEALIDNFFYSEYANASAGTGTVASFISAFNTTNSIIHPFFGDNLAAALVPAAGHGLTAPTNTGFIEADYSVTLGLQGDGTSYLTLGINLATLSPTNLTVLTAIRLDGASQNYLFSFAGGINLIRAATLFNGDYYIRIQSNSGSVIPSPPSELIATINSTPTEQRIFNGLTSVATASAATGSFVTTDLRLGNNSASFSGDFNLLAISNRLLTNDERTILHNATAAFVAARKLL